MPNDKIILGAILISRNLPMDRAKIVHNPVAGVSDVSGDKPRFSLFRVSDDIRLKRQLAHPKEQQDRELIQWIKDQQTRQHRAYEDLLMNIELSHPEYASLVRVESLTLNDIQHLLKPDTTLLSYFVTPATTLAFLITRDSFTTIKLPVSEHALGAAIANARSDGWPSASPPQALDNLYNTLIAPLKNHLSTRVLGIIPHGVLHYLPFAALADGQRYLSDEYTLFTLPSASVLQFLPGAQPTRDSRVLALANGQAAGLSSLEGVNQEVRAIAQRYKTHLLIGENATETALREGASTHAIIHLAAHGALNTTSPLFSRILLSPDQEHDGALEVHEVYELDLQQTELVVLSACETHLGKQSRGDDIIGLTRAFMYAGTPSVIASLWKVNDQATSDLMTLFYKHLKQGNSKARALQIAQQKIRSRYPHPYYWAAFVLTGDPGVSTAQVPWFNILIILLLIGGILGGFLKWS